MVVSHGRKRDVRRCGIAWVLCPRDGNVISDRNPGLVGRTALSLVRVRSVRVVAANSLTLFPEARATKKRVLRKRLVGVAE